MKRIVESIVSESLGQRTEIHMDLPSGDDRERVIQYVYERYSPRGAAMTANVITYRHKSASREMGRGLGISQEMVERLSTVFSNFEWKDPSDTLELSFRASSLDI